MTRRPSARLVLVVAAAGAVGALARSGLGVLLPTADGGVPIATLLANLTGSLLLGLLVARAPADPRLRPVLGTGLLGGWTSWSALALETDRLLADAPVVGLGYLLVSVGLGALLAGLGLRAGAR